MQSYQLCLLPNLPLADTAVQHSVSHLNKHQALDVYKQPPRGHSRLPTLWSVRRPFHAWPCQHSLCAAAINLPVRAFSARDRTSMTSHFPANHNWCKSSPRPEDSHPCTLLHCFTLLLARNLARSCSSLSSKQDLERGTNVSLAAARQAPHT